MESGRERGSIYAPLFCRSKQIQGAEYKIEYFQSNLKTLPTDRYRVYLVSKEKICGYHVFKLISPMQQQIKMAEMLVKRKKGIGKPAQKNKKGIGKPAEKKIYFCDGGCMNLFCICSKRPIRILSLKKMEWIPYTPQGMIGRNAPLEFDIPGNSASYIDLNRSRLRVGLHILM